MSPARARRADANPQAEILIQSPKWKALPRVQSTVRKAVGEAAAAVPTASGEIAIVLADDSTLRTLNRDWRGIDKPTNVLSFPAKELHAKSRAPVVLGDIVIAYETTAREAKEQGKTLAHHLSHLTVHGYLHLAGYDHENDADAEEMEELEIAILARLKIPDPYLMRDR